MKLILSRKGFDSVYGGKASPIFPDGTMVSIPIPAGNPTQSDPKISSLEFNKVNLGDLMVGLGASRKQGKQRVKLTLDSSIHRDPDIYPEFSNAEGDEWRAAFGQVGGPQTHLAKQSVGKGDLFLFFGWFHRLAKSNSYEYERDKPDIHAIFGWLQVGEVVHLNDDAGQPDSNVRRRLIERYPYLQKHPHVAPREPPYPNNTLYVASDRLEIQGRCCDNLAGAGAFRHYDDRLQLTDPDGKSRKHWRLPAWFYPDDMNHALTHHGKSSRWEKYADHTRLQSVDIGQEFVLDTKYYPEAKDWVAELIRDASTNHS